MDQIVLDTKEGMIRTLVQSKMINTLVGIKSRVLGPGTYFTTVKEIQMREDDQFIVKLEGYDMTGYVLDKSELNLEDIEYVIPLNSIFENPFARELKREIKTSRNEDLELGTS